MRYAGLGALYARTNAGHFPNTRNNASSLNRIARKNAPPIKRGIRLANGEVLFVFSKVEAERAAGIHDVVRVKVVFERAENVILVFAE